MERRRGGTDQSVTVYLYATDGSPYTTGAYDDAGIALWYRRGATGSKTAIPPASIAVTDAHSDGGIVVVDENAYRLDLPDAACAAGVDYVQIGGSADDWNMLSFEVRLTDHDPSDLPDSADVNAQCDTAISDAALATAAAVATVDTVVDAIKAKTDLLNFTGNDVQAVLDATALALFVTEDTGETEAAAGSVASLSQGAGTLTEEYLDAALEGKTVYAAGSAPDDSVDFNIRRGNTVSVDFTVSSDLVADPAALYVTLKHTDGQDDNQAILQVKRTAGAAVNALQYINGQEPGDAGVAGTDASLTIDEASDTVTLSIKAAAAALLKPRVAVLFDVKQVESDGTATSLATGSSGTILADITRAIT